MKPIGISTEFILPGKVGGAEYHTRNLVEGFLDILPDGETLSLFGPPSSFDKPSPKFKMTAAGITGGNRFLRETWSYARHGSSVRGIIYSNYFTPPWPKSCPIITVIHDAQYRHMPENFSAKKRAWMSAAHRLTLMHADTVITTTEFVKQDLLTIHGSRWERKIKVIPIPVSWNRFSRPAGSKPPSQSGPYVLSVAAHYPHKNLPTLIRAFSEVRRNFPGMRLVLAGQLPENLIGSNKAMDVRKLAQSLGLVDAVEVTGYISNGDLAGLYEGAECFVFPSLFEGFGLPPVEALGFGLPVITTDRASIPEATLGMARYLGKPEDATELAQVLIEVLRNPAAYRKTPEEVARIRGTYAPPAIAKRYYDLLG